MSKAIQRAVGRMGALKFFPSDAEARAEIMRLLERMVGTPEQLEWLVLKLMDEVGEWPGTLELRGLFCTQFQPRDGVLAECTLPVARIEHRDFSDNWALETAGWGEGTNSGRQGLPGSSQRQLEASGGRRAIAGSTQEPVQPLGPGELETAWRDAVSKMEQKALNPNRADRLAAEAFARRVGYLPGKKETIQ